MTSPASRDPLHGVTLKAMLTELHAHYGWQGLSTHVKIKCFSDKPSISSSLKFLRRTPWARKKVEDLYLAYRRAKAANVWTQGRSPKPD